MGKQAAALILLALLAAGCAQPTDVVPTAKVSPATAFDLPTGDAASGAFGFHHAGGQVRFGLGSGSANVTLFGPDDERLAAFPLADDPEAALAVAAPAGDLVVLVSDASRKAAGLRIDSQGAPVARLQRLPMVSSFVVLAQDNVPVMPFPAPSPGLFGRRSWPINLTLDSPPIRGIELSVAGGYDNLDVALQSGQGALLASSQRGGSSALGPAQGHPFWPVPSTSYPQNASGLRLTGTVAYDGLDGGLVLTWISYSRAGHWPRDDTSAPYAKGAFSYGKLPAGPVQAQLSGAARVMVLSDAPEPGADVRGAAVQVWDPQDTPLGPFLVPGSGMVGIPIKAGGDYVFVVMNGTAQLAADRAPSDFDFHPLNVAHEIFPRSPSGCCSRFGEQTVAVDVQGVPYHVEKSWRQPDSIAGICDDEARLQLIQGNHTVGSNGADEFASAGLFLGSGHLSLHAAGFTSETCYEPVVQVSSYLRPYA
ncbi:MAG: hypothetical protein ABR562_08635 [Thermoplasmatota archaeon]